MEITDLLDFGIESFKLFVATDYFLFICTGFLVCWLVKIFWKIVGRHGI